MKISKSFKDIGLSPIVEISERARSLAPEYEKRTGMPFVYFQRGEVGSDTPQYIVDALNEAVAVKKLTKYPKSGGEPWFKDAVISHLSESGVIGLDRNNIVCTYGGQEGLELSFKLFEGARAAGFGPIWSCILENIVPYSQVDMKLVPLVEQAGELKIDYNNLEKTVRQVDFFYLNNPQNPTGRVFSREELETINSLCKANNVTIISDEAYKDIVFDSPKRHVSMLEFDGDHIISVFTFSKTFSATGLRAGYTVSRNKEVIDLMTRGNYTQTAGVVTAIQYAMKAALENKVEREKWLSSYVGELRKRRDILFEGLKDINNSTYKPEGAFYFFPNLNSYIPEGIENKDKYLLDKFLENGIAVVRGSSFGKDFEGYARISFSTVNQATLKTGIERMKHLVKNLK